MWTLQDAKNRFSAVVDAAVAGHPQEVSRRGRPAVVVIATDDYRRLIAEAGQRHESFADHLLGFPAGDLERLSARPRDTAF